MLNAPTLRRWTSLAALMTAPVLMGANEERPPVWNLAGKRALRVWIQQSEQRDAVRRAVLEWNALALPVRLRFGPDSVAADVRVSWIEKFDEPISGRTTCINEGGRHIVKADVTLAMKHSDNRVLSREEMRVLALHELGHALGLDHVADSTSIMAARVRVRAISVADRKRVLSLYSDNKKQ
jgi:predicted Zn-dependent protease